MRDVRGESSVLHLDLDAFFAAVEQRDKPSLRGRPVVVGGTGGRGVVATASYEARRYGVRSAMSTREARARCPHAAFLGGRFPAYREASRAVMAVLRAASPLVEPLSLDEAFVDLAASEDPALASLEVPAVTEYAELLRARVAEATDGLTCSVGVATSKFMAKVASDLDKPDGLVVVAPGTERELLRPMSVTVIPGVGPATAERLRRVGVQTVAQLEEVSEEELVRLVGTAHGTSLFHLARAEDDRAVVAEREAKSVSVEGTYDSDLSDLRLMEHLLVRQSAEVATRLGKAGLSGRKVEYVNSLAQAIVTGQFDPIALEQQADSQVIASICMLRGLGRWSAEVYLMFSLQRPDVFPAGDLALQRALQKLKGWDNRPSADETRAAVAHWMPWRTVGSLFLWHFYRGAPT